MLSPLATNMKRTYLSFHCHNFNRRLDIGIYDELVLDWTVSGLQI